jgi:hypothetical protein
VADAERAFTNFSMSALSRENMTLDDPKDWTKVPGLFRVPVCDWATADANYRAWGRLTRDRRTKERPCNWYPCCQSGHLAQPRRFVGLSETRYWNRSDGEVIVSDSTDFLPDDTMVPAAGPLWVRNSSPDIE